MAKKRRVPEVLWRIFRNRARTLGDTIISLIPPSTAECRCKGRRCLSCSGVGAMSYLLRPGDPSDYRKLLAGCFVVISANAPPPSAFYPDRRWSLHEVVKKTIEMILCEGPSFSNILCTDYDKHCRCSPAVELLTSSTWGLLWRRVGDELTFYLLKYASIFLPLPRQKLYQVAGFPVNDICFKSKNLREPNFQHSSFVLGIGQKRKRVDEPDLTLMREQSNSAIHDDVLVSSVKGLGCNGGTDSTSFSRRCGEKINQRSLSREAMSITRTANANNEGNHNEPDKEISNQVIVKPRKRLRLVSWQRQRKSRKLDVDSQSRCTNNVSDRDCSDGRLQSDFNRSIPLQCSCCLFLQTLQHVPRKAQIDRRSMFCRLDCSSSVFPRNHVLNSLKPNLSGAKTLFKQIFGIADVNIHALLEPCFHHSSCCHIYGACLYHSIIKLLKTLIRKANRCQHLRLLEKHCSLPSLDQNADGGAGSKFEGNKYQINSHGVDVQQVGKMSHDRVGCFGTTKHKSDPSQSYCLKKHVVSFIWAVCRNVVPPNLLGTSSNWRTLRRNISRFVRLRKFEKFSLKQCMHKFKTSMFHLLSNRHSLCYLNDHVPKCPKVQSADMPREYRQVRNITDAVTHKIVQNWIFWFFSCLVVPLVQAHFYVTDSQQGKQDLFYYQKPIWENVMNKAITNLVDRDYRPLNEAAVRTIISKRPFGFSRVRFLPKGNGVRALANLKAPSRFLVKEYNSKVIPHVLLRKASCRQKDVKYLYFKSVNALLRDLHAVLKGLQMKEPEKLGSSVFDYTDVHRKLCHFLSVLKNGLTTTPAVFIVVSDVSKAFDTVNQDKLLSVMKDVILQDEYLVKQTHQVVCPNKGLWVHQNFTLAAQDTSDGSTIFTSSASKNSLHGILVNQGWSKNVRTDKLFSLLTEHVKRNVLQVNKKFYLQDVGIPQGSVLSSLLCSFYYGHLERNVILPFLQKSEEQTTEDLSGTYGPDASAAVKSTADRILLSSPKYMLLRFIDDFIFISTSKKQAASLFSRLRRGFREYNCYMNDEKFGLNFDVDNLSGLVSNRVYRGEDGISFVHWSGLFINCCTLEVQTDYSRYLNTPLRSSLTVCWQGKPIRHLKEKLLDFLRPRCQPILYDSNINSAAVVRLNIYQAFLLCAMKFHCYVCNLFNICKIDTRTYMGTIEKSFRGMHKTVKKRMYTVDLGSSFRPIFQVERKDFEWLGLVAYTRVLQRKQSRHKELLSLLRSKLIEHEAAQSVSSVLKYAADDSHSSIIWKIRY